MEYIGRVIDRSVGIEGLTHFYKESRLEGRNRLVGALTGLGAQLLLPSFSNEGLHGNVSLAGENE